MVPEEGAGSPHAALWQEKLEGEAGLQVPWEISPEVRHAIPARPEFMALKKHRRHEGGQGQVLTAEKAQGATKHNS